MSGNGRQATVIAVLGTIMFSLFLILCRPGPSAEWQFPGGDPANTRFCGVSGPRLRQDWQWHRVWEAEDFLPLQYQPDPLTHALEYQLLITQVNPGHNPDIILNGPAGFSAVLDQHGVLRWRLPQGERVAAVYAPRRGPAAIVSCSLDVVRVRQARAARRIRTRSPVLQACLVPRTRNAARPFRPSVHAAGTTVITVETREPAEGDAAFLLPARQDRDSVPLRARTTAIAGYNLVTGDELWRYEIGASLCRIWAVADVNRDSLPELIVGTYGDAQGSGGNRVGDTARLLSCASRLPVG